MVRQRFCDFFALIKGSQNTQIFWPGGFTPQINGTLGFFPEPNFLPNKRYARNLDGTLPNYLYDSVPFFNTVCPNVSRETRPIGPDVVSRWVVRAFDHL